ncbi:hypothetical protein HET73_02055 [Wolbachia endosymbiont of Atemnus politus]|uniref:hypothetical protein n=1 Tax=Wolbachia endosymbiont of Atemnus politus TaxID=2682840 RepID=UPI001572BCE6|nr:hypothetical protein [Wolbachia endosymbiont of Atemnus politus]NSM56387.1 hypothetical protein [Wolbachia endosymbiont of Atemnus politus]
MYNIEINNLKKLKEIIHKFIKYSDEYNQFVGDEQNPALNLYKAETDLIKLEEITRNFVNNSGNISEEAVLEDKECIITLPAEKQLVENLRELEERISGFIKFVNNGQPVNDRQYAALSLCYGGKDLTTLAKITHELFHEEDFVFVNKEDVPDKPSTEVQNTSRVRILSWLGFYS